MSASPKPDRAILLVAHGSRSPDAAAQTSAVAARMQARRPAWLVRFAHLELVPPPVPEAIDACVAAGATEIIVQPLLLAVGRHSARDIPDHLAAASRRHPGVTFKLGEVIGDDDRLVELLLARADRAHPW